jgi:hypothetical protein
MDGLFQGSRIIARSTSYIEHFGVGAELPCLHQVLEDFGQYLAMPGIFLSQGVVIKFHGVSFSRKIVGHCLLLDKAIIEFCIIFSKALSPGGEAISELKFIKEDTRCSVQIFCNFFEVPASKYYI